MLEYPPLEPLLYRVLGNGWLGLHLNSPVAGLPRSGSLARGLGGAPSRVLSVESHASFFPCRVLFAI